MYQYSYMTFLCVHELITVQVVGKKEAKPPHPL